MFFVPVYADIVIEQPLSFGKIALSSNSSVSTTTVRRNGTQSSTNKLYVVERGAPAMLSFSNFPPYVNLVISAALPVSSSMVYPGTQQFSITSLDMPNQVKMDASGMGSLLIGGTLATSGLGGVYYNNAPYIIYIDIEFTY
jgi:hypothetical protein